MTFEHRRLAPILTMACWIAMAVFSHSLVASDASSVELLVSRKLHVDRFTRCEIRLPLLEGEGISRVRVAVEHEGQTKVLRLERHSNRSAAFRLLVQGRGDELRDVVPPPPRTFRGVVEGVPGSRVAASLLPEGLSAHVMEPSGEAWAVCALRLLEGDADPSSHLVYSLADRKPFLCGTSVDAEGPRWVSPSDAPAKGAAGGGGQDKGPCLLKVADVAFDSDFEFYEDQGGDDALCTAIIEDGLNTTNLIYTRDVKITHRLSAIVLRTDPAADFYAQFPDASDFGAMLVAFRQEWNENMQHIDRDVAYLLTGKSRPEYGGLAYVRVVCSSWHYGMGIGGPGYEGIFRHEVGHNWGAGHSCGAERRYIMCGNSISAISAYNIRVMTDFSDSIGCLETTERETDPSPPFVRLDRVLARQGGGPIALAVLDGDTDANCDSLRLVSHSEHSSFGAEIRVLDPVEADGRESLLYVPRSSFVGTDFFSYTVTDATGFEEEGQVLVEVLPRAMIVYLPLDEVSGIDARDRSGHGHDGELREDLSFDQHSVVGRYGRALGFRGVDGEYVSLGDDEEFDLSTGLTVAAWFRVGGFSGEGETLVGKGDSAWRLKRDGTRSALRFTCTGLNVAGSDDGDLAGSIRVNDGEWHHAAGVFDGTRISLYVDGELDASLPATGRIQRNSSSVHVGDSGWDGAIDEVRIYNHGLTGKEIQALFRGGRIENPDPCDGADGVVPGAAIDWIPAPGATAHDVYLGTDCAAVAAAEVTSPEYLGRRSSPAIRPALEPAQTYFWRVDEVAGDEVYRGDVRRFTANFAFTEFDVPSLGDTSFTATAGDREIGFETVWAPTDGSDPFVGVIETGSTSTSPIFSHRSVDATTVFEAVPLAGEGDAAVSLILQARSTGYEEEDFIEVRVEDGGKSLPLLQLASVALNQRAGTGYSRLVASLPQEWTSATLSISSSSNSSAGSERYDFDSIGFFRHRPDRVIAFTSFEEPPVDADSHGRQPGMRELGFVTEWTPSGGASPFVGVQEWPSSLRPRRLTHRSVRATTTFETVDLSDLEGVVAVVVLRVLDTGYESGDFLRISLTDGVDRVDLIEADGSGGLDAMADGLYHSYSGRIPDSWRRATISIDSLSDSSTGAEGYDIRSVELVSRWVHASCEVEAPAGTEFRRGDANGDGDLDLSDGIRILNFLFVGGSPLTCRDAADTDDSGTVDLSDGVRVFNFLFLGGAPPATPGHEDCGPDASEDDLSCESYPDCE